MKPEELKREYIQLRAEGLSYSAICSQLNISKSTCTKWDRDLRGQIDELKRAELLELGESYGISKEARIKRLGGTLDKINTELEKRSFEDVETSKLLDYKLKYTEALKEEYIGIQPAFSFQGKVTPGEIVSALGDLLDRVRAGEVTDGQAQKESIVLSHLLRAYDTAEVKLKLSELEAVMRR